MGVAFGSTDAGNSGATIALGCGSAGVEPPVAADSASASPATSSPSRIRGIPGEPQSGRVVLRPDGDVNVKLPPIGGRPRRIHFGWLARPARPMSAAAAQPGKWSLQRSRTHRPCRQHRRSSAHRARRRAARPGHHWAGARSCPVRHWRLPRDRDRRRRADRPAADHHQRPLRPSPARPGSPSQCRVKA